MSQNESSDKNRTACCTAKIHFGYIISILVVIIIALLTVKWSDIPALAEHLNFALGITSLVLAVVAIVYAFFANNSFNVTVSKLESAATTIKDETGDLERAVHGLELQLKDIPDKLLSLEGQVSKTHALVEASSQQPKSQITVQKPDVSVEEFANNVVDRFLNVSSWNGLKVMYLCCLACEKQKEFDLKEWTTMDQSISYDYAYGFLIAASSAGFFDHVMQDTKVRVTAMPQPVAHKIRPVMDARIKVFPVPFNKTWPPQIEIIEKFIG
ncbi:MAG: hypothetical protein HZA89_12725 [Verrucomicrobia bacterium]|nr:hypothetical protein [Verrucomicrobiota bacterium]